MLAAFTTIITRSSKRYTTQSSRNVPRSVSRAVYWACPGRSAPTSLQVIRCTKALRSGPVTSRSEEHTSELQSRLHLVCRLLLEKKKKKKHNRNEHMKLKQIEIQY